jgi:hypothetical protein
LIKNCYANMFNGCTNLNYIKMLATDVDATAATSYWIKGISASGTFVKNKEATWANSKVGIPSGWTVIEE